MDLSLLLLAMNKLPTNWFYIHMKLKVCINENISSVERRHESCDQ